jgi:hypothetical protein
VCSSVDEQGKGDASRAQPAKSWTSYPLNGDSASIGCLSVLSVARACAGGFWETASCDRLASVDVAYWRLAARGKATGGEGTESSFPARDTEQRKLAHISVVSDTRGEFSVFSQAVRSFTTAC